MSATKVSKKFPGVSQGVIKLWHNIENRCCRQTARGFKYYGGRGIKNLLTPFDLQALWNRDGASRMQRPSIDRIDSAGHYAMENCRFVELIENVMRRWGARTMANEPLYQAGSTRTIVMSDEQWNQLQQQAAKEEISASAIIRRLVREYLDQVKQKERRKVNGMY